MRPASRKNPIKAPRTNSRMHQKSKLKKQPITLRKQPFLIKKQLTALKEQPATLKKKITEVPLRLVRYMVWPKKLKFQLYRIPWTKVLKFQEYGRMTTG